MSLHGNEQNEVAIKVIKSFLNARSHELSERSENRLLSRLAANQLSAGKYEDAIKTCTHLIIYDDESRLDYMLWCGEAFMQLDKNQMAAMYFGEIVRALTDSQEDFTAIQAQKFLELMQVSSDLALIFTPRGTK